MRHATECGERDVMRFVGETAGCLVEKDIELRGAVEDLDRRIEEIRLQIVMLSGKKEGRGRFPPGYIEVCCGFGGGGSLYK